MSSSIDFEASCRFRGLTVSSGPNCNGDLRILEEKKYFVLLLYQRFKKNCTSLLSVIQMSN